MLGNYRGEGRYYPAVIVDDGPRVVYADGVTEDVPQERLRPDWIRAGVHLDRGADGARRRVEVVDREGDAVRARSDGEPTPTWTATIALSVDPTDAAAHDGDGAFVAAAPIVLAPWQDDVGWRYPGVVVEETATGRQIAFHDGSSDERTADPVAPFTLAPGDPVQVKGADGWSDATFVRRVAFAVEVREEATGELAWTALARLRVPAP